MKGEWKGGGMAWTLSATDQRQVQAIHESIGKQFAGCPGASEEDKQFARELLLFRERHGLLTDGETVDPEPAEGAPSEPAT